MKRLHSGTTSDKLILKFDEYLVIEVSTFEHFSFFSTYDKVEKKKNKMYKVEKNKKSSRKTQSNDHGVVTRGQKV